MNEERIIALLSQVLLHYYDRQLEGRDEIIGVSRRALEYWAALLRKDHQGVNFASARRAEVIKQIEEILSA